MPKGDTELLSRDAKRHIGRELLRAIKEVKAGKGLRYQVAAKPGGTSENRHKKRSASKLPTGVKAK